MYKNKRLNTRGEKLRWGESSGGWEAIFHTRFATATTTMNLSLIVHPVLLCESMELRDGMMVKPYRVSANVLFTVMMVGEVERDIHNNSCVLVKSDNCCMLAAGLLSLSALGSNEKGYVVLFVAVATMAALSYEGSGQTHRG